jgi:predicted exporter
MSSRRYKILSRLILAAAVLAGGLWLWKFDYDRKVSTDVLDLVPVDEREPELALVRQMADERVARVVLLALEFPKNGATSSAEKEEISTAFVEKLRGSPAFAEVVRLGDIKAFVSIGTYLFAHRYELLLPAKLASWKREYAAEPRSQSFADWASAKAAADLSSYLAKPDAVAFQDMLPADPLLLLPDALEPWHAFSSIAGSGSSNTVLVWARTAASPLREEGQKPVFDAISEAEKLAHAKGDVQLRWTGVGRFAEASRRRIEREMSGLNTLSLIAVLAIGFLGVRRPYKALNLAPVLLFSLLGAWLVTTCLFERVHVLVFVVGSLLGGVAVDYGFYLFLQPPMEGEPPLSKAKRLLKPLLTSSLTAVTGFLLLVCSDLPLIRQLGVFVSAGLVCALAAAYLWFAQSGDTWWETRRIMRSRLPGAGRLWVLRVMMMVGAVVVIAGGMRLRWRDDIRQLDIASPELRKNAEEVQALFGEDDNRTLYLSRGETAEQAREALERFGQWHGSAFPGSNAVSVGHVVPRPEDFKALPENLAQLAGFEDAFRKQLVAQGFDESSFAPFFESWQNVIGRTTWPSFDELVGNLRGALNGPVGLMMETGSKGTWFATLTNHAPGAEPPTSSGSVSAAQLESFNRLFSRYRVSALWLSSAGLAFVGLSVLMVYGVRRGIRIFALPAGCCLFAFGLLGLAGQTLNLFHLLGAFLGVCLSHNYAIFSAENAARGEVAPPSIRLSALTTAASFGVLSLSHIPVISSLGLMVGVIVLTALLVVEMDPFSGSVVGQTNKAGHIKGP